MKTDHTVVNAFILLGSNVGERLQHLQEAARSLGEHFQIIAASAVYETDAWGDRSQEPYLNQALLIEVDKDPVQLHALTRAIEKKMGRMEKGNFRPRQIDIDILFYADEIIETDHLTIPHPRIQMRRFVLVPLTELDQNLVHPVFGKTIKEMLEECRDMLGVSVYGGQ
jgi:2-amino-4-hydroxy-6-hydroxymethyldihydropteridine diphosphokinase